MFVERLELVDFRSYVRADVPMAAGATTFIGSNGQGKTNLVEACLLYTSPSPRD